MARSSSSHNFLNVLGCLTRYISATVIAVDEVSDPAILREREKNKVNTECVLRIKFIVYRKASLGVQMSTENKSKYRKTRASVWTARSVNFPAIMSAYSSPVSPFPLARSFA